MAITVDYTTSLNRNPVTNFCFEIDQVTGALKGKSTVQADKRVSDEPYKRIAGIKNSKGEYDFTGEYSNASLKIPSSPYEDILNMEDEIALKEENSCPKILW